jgi:hypothetical protein
MMLAALLALTMFPYLLLFGFGCFLVNTLRGRFHRVCTDVLHRRTTACGPNILAKGCENGCNLLKNENCKVGTNFADKRGRSVGIVRWRTKAPEFVCVCFFFENC